MRQSEEPLCDTWQRTGLTRHLENVDAAAGSVPQLQSRQGGPRAKVEQQLEREAEEEEEGGGQYQEPLCRGRSACGRVPLMLARLTWYDCDALCFVPHTLFAA